MSEAPQLLVALVLAGTVAAAWQAVRSSPGMLEALARATTPLTLAAREGRLPSNVERRRLVLASIGLSVAIGWLLFGLVFALVLALTAPGAVLAAIRRSRARYVRAVSRDLPEVAGALADGLAAGRSVRGALEAVTVSVEGPARVEFAKLAADLGLGVSTERALGELRERIGTRRVESFSVALLSQRLAGGDLAGLMRRFGESAAESDRIADDARAATAQARFTGWLVVAMPAGAALLAQLISPGFFGSLLGSGLSLAMLLAAVAMQVAGFLLISRLARIEAE